MPPQSTKDWLVLLERKAQNRGVYVDIDIDGRIFHFHLGEDPGVIGKVRYSQGKSREYENEQGQKHIWHRYNREKEAIKQGHERKVVNITLDVWSKDVFDPDDHHFIFLTERLIQEETYSKGDQKIWIEGGGEYSGPLAEYVDDWDAIFEYASDPNVASGSTSSRDRSTPATEDGRQSADSDTSGSISQARQTQVRVSEAFKSDVYERFDQCCPLSGIEHPEMLTVSHILDRSERPDLAEDIENVLLLDWTHHMAFDGGLWTFDESGRLWIKPGFETESSSLSTSLMERHGTKIDEFSMIADKYIERNNEQLAWWPPR